MDRALAEAMRRDFINMHRAMGSVIKVLDRVIAAAGEPSDIPVSTETAISATLTAASELCSVPPR